MNNFLMKVLSAWEPRKFKLVPESLLFEVETPSHKFTYVIAYVGKWEEYLCVISRDSFNEGLAADVMHHAMTTMRKDSAGNAIQVSSTLKAKNRKFDSVLLVGVEGKAFYLEPDLEDKVCVAYPLYRCELNGSESVKMLDGMMHEGLELLDWNREPYPKLEAEFKNSQYASERRGSISLEQATRVLEVMDGDFGSWFDVVNFQNRVMRISWSDGQFRYNMNEKNVICNAIEMKSGFVQFAYGV